MHKRTFLGHVYLFQPELGPSPPLAYTRTALRRSCINLHSRYREESTAPTGQALGQPHLFADPRRL